MNAECFFTNNQSILTLPFKELEISTTILALNTIPDTCSILLSCFRRLFPGLTQSLLQTSATSNEVLYSSLKMSVKSYFVYVISQIVGMNKIE